MGSYGAWGGVVRVEKIIEVFRVIVNNWPCRIKVFKIISYSIWELNKL